MKIETVLSTVNCRDTSDLRLEDKNIRRNLLIINQSDSNYNLDFSDNIRIKTFSEKGLSVSRNKGIENSKADIIILADDDNFFVNDYQEILEGIYQRNSDVDVITYKAFFPDNQEIKKYSDKQFVHNLRTILQVSSWEISFRRTSIVEKKIKFDERFGLGSEYGLGEENIFLKDCLNAGLKILYIPIIISGHPKELTTGEKWGEQIERSRGAVFVRLFGWKFLLLNFLFAVKKYKFYKKKINFFLYLKLIYSGSFDYIKKYGR